MSWPHVLTRDRELVDEHRGLVQLIVRPEPIFRLRRQSDRRRRCLAIPNHEHSPGFDGGQQAVCRVRAAPLIGTKSTEPGCGFLTEGKEARPSTLPGTTTQGRCCGITTPGPVAPLHHLPAP